MPNTLAHIGLHGLATRSFLKGADLRWVYLGAVIPDLPWILQRICGLFPLIDPFDLRLYAIVQASLFFSLILSSAFSMLSASPWKTFSILGSGTFLHLFFDALQIKWANGVHFFAPFNWRLTRFSLVWPESFVSYAVTTFGLFYICYHWKMTLNSAFPLCLKPGKHLVAALLAVLIYLFLPFALLDGPESMNNHFLLTLRSVEDRKGQAIEVDRAYYAPQASAHASAHASEGVLHLFTGEKIKVSGIDLQSSALISIRGKFTEKNRISVDEYHVHSMFRDLASYAGLLLIAILWFWSTYRHLRTHS